MSGIAVLDAGGQYCHLIARRVGELGVSSKILPLDVPAVELQEFDGIIISGGPSSVYEEGAPSIRPAILELGKPLLGICYGQQLIAQLLDGEVRPGETKEFGTATLTVVASNTIFTELPEKQSVWMSHGDTIQRLPSGFTVLAHTDDCPFAAIANLEKHIYGLQFHPEVTHTKCGTAILRNFLFRVCKTKEDKDLFSSEYINRYIRETSKGRKVYFLVSGGVDSTVAYTLCAKALPKDQLEGLYVDTGFMRKHESEQLQAAFLRLGLPNIHVIDKSDQFFKSLAGIVDPEIKRKYIGKLFYEIQEEIAQSFESQSHDWVLGQGTIYPDTIESGGTAQSSLIKTHHNRVPAISELAKQGRLLEPLRDQYKDGVRKIGKELGLPDDLINRHPFPGPGLAIRTLCTTQQAKSTPHKKVMDICKEHGLRGCTLPLRSVGVQGDSRSYMDVAIIAGEAELDILEKVSTAITNTCIDVNRVAYCLDPLVDLDALCVYPAFLTKERVGLLREADAIAHQILESDRSTHDVWQFPVILIPVSQKEFSRESVVLRPVRSIDGMTAEFAKLPIPILQRMAKAILKLDQVGFVFFDVSNKPPATIEWE